MFSIRPPTTSSTPSKYTPNLLPCRIHHDGSVNALSRYWEPQNDKDGYPEAYVRGRKLKGRKVKLPEGYRGVIVKDGPKEVDPQQQRRNAERLRRRDEQNVDEDEDGDEEEEELQIMEEVGEFDEVVVWGHERTVEGDDEVVRGMEEWIRFAEAMHGPRLVHGQGEAQTKKP
ncbi:MAG: hypothetical protein Q9218_004946 [Villophora microphyllina]